MNSPGHKKNLLHPSWTHVGVYVLHYKTAPGPQAGWDGFLLGAEFCTNTVSHGRSGLPALATFALLAATVP